jgi:hypothetical protein
MKKILSLIITLAIFVLLILFFYGVYLYPKQTFIIIGIIASIIWGIAIYNTIYDKIK